MEDYFLKIDGIPGESQDSKHKEEIELVSFSWGLTHPVPGPVGAGVSGGRAQFKEFEFLMRVNKASPQLFLASASGKHIKEANLSVRRGQKGNAVEYLKIKLTDVIISSFEETGSGDVPAETVAFNFGRIDVSYSQQQPTGAADAAVTAGFDLSANIKA